MCEIDDGKLWFASVKVLDRAAGQLVEADPLTIVETVVEILLEHDVAEPVPRCEACCRASCPHRLDQPVLRASLGSDPVRCSLIVPHLADRLCEEGLTLDRSDCEIPPGVNGETLDPPSDDRTDARRQLMPVEAPCHGPQTLVRAPDLGPILHATHELRREERMASCVIEQSAPEGLVEVVRHGVEIGVDKCAVGRQLEEPRDELARAVPVDLLPPGGSVAKVMVAREGLVVDPRDVAPALRPACQVRELDVQHRGLDRGDPTNLSNAYVSGYRPLLQVGQNERGELQVLPYNLELVTVQNHRLQKLPGHYRQLFSFRPVTDPGLLGGRDKDLAAVGAHAEQWKRGLTNALILVAPAGSGHTSFFNVLRETAAGRVLLLGERTMAGSDCAVAAYRFIRTRRLALLLEEAGLKGRRIGDAEVSERHANFIVHKGGASAEDILRLSRQVAREVYRMFGVRLQREVELWGRFGSSGRKR